MHPNELRRLAAAATAVIALCAVRASMARAEQHVACPTTVDARQVTVGAPADWAGIYGPSGSLSPRNAEVIFTIGSLREPWGELRDPPTVKGKDSIRVTYPLPAEHEFGKWVICDYGDRVYLALKLPDKTAECVVTYRQGDAVDPATRKRKMALSDIVCR